MVQRANAFNKTRPWNRENICTLPKSNSSVNLFKLKYMYLQILASSRCILSGPKSKCLVRRATLDTLPKNILESLVIGLCWMAFVSI